MTELQGRTFSSDWEWRTQTAVPPPNGKASSNTGNWTGVTTLILSAKNHYGEDMSADINTLLPGDTVKIEQKSDAAIFSNWTVSAAPIDNAGYYAVTVSAGAVQGTPQANTLMRVTLTHVQVPGPSPESALYWVLTGPDLALLQQNADKLILAGFQPLGTLSAIGSTPTYYQAFWRQDAVPRFLETTRP